MVRRCGFCEACWVRAICFSDCLGGSEDSKVNERLATRCEL